MKKLSLLLVLLFLFVGCARFIKAPEKERKIRKIYKVNLSADEIYLIALEWMATNIVSNKEAIVMKDREKKKLVGRGVGEYSEYFNFFVDRPFSYTVVIEAKDKRYRVTFSNLVVQYEDRTATLSPAKYKFEIKKISQKLNKKLVNLKSLMDRGGKEDDDWGKEKEKAKEKEEAW